MNEPNTSQNRSEKEIFFEALDKNTQEQLAAFLDGACGKNLALRARIEALLTDHFQQDSFMKKPAVEEGRPTIRVSPVEEIVGMVIGRYKLLQQIGEGGCGIVYMAEQQEPVRRRVALKVIKLGMDTRQVIARFEAERQVLALMDHANIAKVLDAGATETGRPYFVMELVKGIPMTRYCDENNLSMTARLGLFVQVCRAIQHAHQKGIIHRDIKPSNVLVADHDGVPVPKIIDFGIAKATTDQRLTDKTLFTAFEQFIGTPAYMSPEQANFSGLDIDTRSDIYSLGVLLYELLTGTTPFEASRLMEGGLDEIRRIIREEEPARPSTKLHTLNAAEQTTVAKHRQSDPPKLSHLISGDLDWIVMKALEKDRARRYETANGLAMDIQRHLNNEPVAARPPSSVYRLQRMVRRNKIFFAAAGIAVAALAIGLCIASWSFLQERQARLHERRLLYAADMNLVQPAWEQNNMVQLDQLLHETRSFPERGFEWYYWQRQAHFSLRTLVNNVQASLSSLALSPDGQRMVTGSFGNTASIWDLASGRELMKLEGHKGYILSVAYSSNGQRIVTGSQDQTAKVWDAATGKMLLTLTGHTNTIHSVAFSPDGRKIASGADDNTARVWDANNGNELFKFKWARVNFVAFSPDGKRILAGSLDASNAQMLDAESGNVLFTLERRGIGIACAAFSPDGKWIATVNADRTATIWDAATGKELRSLAGHSDAVAVTDFSPASVAFSPDSRRIVTGGWDRAVNVWETATGKELVKFKEHLNAVSSVAFTPDGLRLITASYDGTVKIWDPDSSPEPFIFRGDNSLVNALAFSPDGQRIVSGSQYQTAKIWDVNSGRVLLTLKGHTNQVLSAAFSPDGSRVVTCSDDHTAKVWDADSGRELLNFRETTNVIRAAAFSPDGLRIVAGCDDATAKVWDSSSGRELLTLRGHTGSIHCVAFSPDGKRIATGSWDWTVKVWDSITGRELITLTEQSPGKYVGLSPITSLSFSPDGQLIATANWDNTAKIWNANSGRLLLTLKGHKNMVGSVSFSADGLRVLTGSSDGTAKVWDPVDGRELLTLDGHWGLMTSANFSPDGRRIAAGLSGMVKIWQAAGKEQVARWQAEEAALVQH